MTSSKIPAHLLAPRHFQTFRNTVTRILNTAEAAETYSQIIDGAPNWNEHRCPVAPHNRHKETSADAIRIWEEFRAQFSVTTWTFKSTTIQGFQNAEPGSRQFIIYLLELVATICHDIAAHLFTVTEGGLRPIQMTHPTHVPGVSPSKVSYAAIPLPPTIFSWDGYVNVGEYPQGVADCVGYWAEFEILGGVALFDRGESGLESKSAFMHPGARYMIFEMSETQLRELLQFGEGQLDAPPFPWKTERWARRVDYTQNFRLGIYRDRYERKLAPGARLGCVRRMEDFPEMLEHNERLKALREEYGDDEETILREFRASLSH